PEDRDRRPARRAAGLPLVALKLEQFLSLLPPGELWVFGYASLMWSPGFAYRERRRGIVHGYHRALCIYSHRHRGTRERPGLVMGLCRGGSCWGMAYRLAGRRQRDILAALWRREMRNYVYLPRLVAVRIAGERRVRALTFVADQDHRQFAGDLDLAQTARLVAQGRGGRGDNVDYLERTLAHMRELGVRDPHLDRVLARAKASLGSDPCG
ncbi:MAG TPA: gamma-glutamylcyclotransferase, partial [Burkholderiales bacterium]|nr:gamma-glutamylcyclotransferase [Burkholderiales bacterium]